MGMFDSFSKIATSVGLPILGGATSLLGGFLGNEASAKEAAKNRKFQAQQSATAHQREVADLRAAGLNPILSATGGSGASTPSGSTATQSDVLSPAIASAMSLMRTIADTQKTMAETNTEFSRRGLVETQTVQASSAAQASRSHAELMDEQNIKTQYENRVNKALWDNPEMGKIIRSNFKLENALKQADKDIAVREAERMKKYKEIDDSQFGPLILFIERMFGSILKRR